MTSQISVPVVAGSNEQSCSGRARTSGVNAVLWIGQGLWGVLFAGSGFGKVLMIDLAIYAKAPEAVAWYGAIPQWLIVLIGVLEVLGGLGLLLPAIARVRPTLTPLAAAGLALTMALATGFHLWRSEVALATVTFGLGAVAALVMTGRHRYRPISPAPLSVSRVLWTSVTLAGIVLLIFVPTWYSATHVTF